MSIFGLFDKVDINEGVRKYKGSSGGVLLDVRTPEEYASGHIPESINIPVDKIGRLTDTVRDKNTEIYVYCRSGARSHRAAYDLKRLGYKNAVNIGGILSYKGLLER